MLLTTQDTIRTLQRKLYASPVRRVMIPKADGSKRPLGIPTIRDRVAQMALKLVMEPIFEADFCEHSYGFVRVAHPASRDQPSAVLRPSGWSPKEISPRSHRRYR